MWNYWKACEIVSLVRFKGGTTEPRMVGLGWSGSVSVGVQDGVHCQSEGSRPASVVTVPSSRHRLDGAHTATGDSYGQRHEGTPI